MFAPDPQSGSADADAAKAEQILQELSHDLMSPYCPGRTIASCPSKSARTLEDQILAEAQAGKSRDQIETQLVARFGSDIVGYKPPPMLLGGTIIGGALALGLLLWSGRRWVRQARGARAVPGPHPEPLAAGPGGGGAGPTRAELDALDDALDDEEGF